MAEGFMRLWGGESVRVMSAGSHPASQVSPLAIEVMREKGIDISHQFPKSLESVADESFDWVITLCDDAKQVCPIFRGKDGAARQLHWSIPDPCGASYDEEEILYEYRSARDLIASRIANWLKEELGIVVEV